MEATKDLDMSTDIHRQETKTFSLGFTETFCEHLENQVLNFEMPAHYLFHYVKKNILHLYV
jgi:hypothetical protein